MSKEPTDQDPLQGTAEAATSPAPKTKPRTAEELLHELQVHQAELEIQNEYLRQAQVELEKSRDRFADLKNLSVNNMHMRYWPRTDECKARAACCE